MAEADPRPPSRRQKQLSIRSDRAVELAKEKAARLGLSLSEVVEQALADFRPELEVVPEGMVRKGKLLVIKATGNGPKTNDEANYLIEMLRTEWADE
jgi:hypothetical protein